MKNKIIICFLVSLSILCSLNCFADLEENIVPEYNSELLFECDEFEFVTENHNINLWVVEDYEKETMHNDEFVFRRKDNTDDAYLVYDLPYVNEFNFTSYFWPTNEGEFLIYVSTDGNEWIETDAEIEIDKGTEDASVWSKHIYSLNSLEKCRFIKIVWPSVDLSVNDWWNPYLGEIQAKIGEPVPTEIVVEDIKEQLEIPRFDVNEYNFTAVVKDQLGIDMDYTLYWKEVDELPKGVTLSENGNITVSSECEDSCIIKISVYTDLSEDDETERMEKEIEITLKDALIGDINKDLKIGQEEIDFVIENYGKNENAEDWHNIRLADIDENGIIDIIDMAYLNYYFVEEEK